MLIPGFEPIHGLKTKRYFAISEDRNVIRTLNARYMLEIAEPESNDFYTVSIECSTSGKMIYENKDFYKSESQIRNYFENLEWFFRIFGR